MTETIPLQPVDRVEITTLCENLVDLMAPGGGAVERLRAAGGGAVVSKLLADERKDQLVGAHGLGVLVRLTRGDITRTLLFDTGGDPDGLIHNLDCLELRPNEFSCIVLSHGHFDHTLGLIGLERRLGHLGVPLTLHPDAFLTRVVTNNEGKPPIPLTPLSRQGLRDAGVELVETDKPSFVLEDMALVSGQVARTNDFEIGWPAHYAYRKGKLEPDPLVCDDQGLIVNVRGKGLVVLSGCGHAGIVNTVNHARAVTGVQDVHAVIGGFHLGPAFFHDRIDPVVDALEAMSPAIIAPAHCTGYRAAYEVYRRMPDAFVQNTVGTRITLAADEEDA
jgi:7,8-dihydropterin-6-yl-methyl-4-(beta-D-ribofuranosyl)aminobenzene 5'-phosphate synthase